MVEENRGTSGGERAEIDTSAPFESVKEAVSRFGGIGFWKPSSHHKSSESENTEEIDIEKLGEETARLEKDLIVKERETLDVLRELESTKLLIDELKSKLQKEEASDADKEEAADQDKENHFATPSLIQMELKQAKLNLSKTTADLTDIRASVESFSKKLEKERLSAEKTHERLTHNSSKMSLLEGELSQTRLKLQLVKNMENYDFTRELHRLSSEMDQLGQASELEVRRALREIEQTKTQITTAEMHLVAAKKMKEAARATEAMAVLEEEEINKALSSSNHHSAAAAVTLTYEEYASLISKARKAEEESNRRVADALVQVDEATMSKVEILKKVEQATEEVKTSKKVLEEALDRVEAANRGKLAVEEALRKWRSRKRQTFSSSSSTKFKNSSSSQFRRHLVDDDDDGATPTAVLKKQTTLSIGQILSQKLLLAEEEFGSEKLVVEEPVKLGEMLSSNNDDDLAFAAADHNHHKQFSSSSKKKKLGIARGFSLLLAKKSKKNKKRPLCDLR